MPPNSIWCAFACPIKFVPNGQILNPRFHTKNIDLFWFSEQITNWINQKNYWNPVQTNDPFPVQFFTNGLAPVTVQVITDNGTAGATTTLTNIPTNATPYSLWEGNIDLSGLAEGGYYLLVTAGTGGLAASIISEGLQIKSDWPQTIAVDYTNTQGFFDNRLKPKFKATFYTDQPQDITLLNAFPYETSELWIGLDDGVPDYLIKQLNRIFLFDTVMLEGIQYTINDGADWEETFIEGNPKKYWKIDIRPSKNIDGIAATANGATSNSSMIITTDANYFGPNVNNASDTTETDIIQVEITE
jgi:hypothetical protein